MLEQIFNGFTILIYKMVFVISNNQTKTIFGLKDQEYKKRFKMIKNLTKMNKNRQI